MKEFFDIQNIMVELWGYKVSYLEASAVVTTLLSVILAAKNNIHTWTTGIVAAILFFVLFFQVQLYSDMFLQVFFVVTSIIGFILWKRPQSKITSLTVRQTITTVAIGTVVSLGLGAFMSEIHLIFPNAFKLPAEFPFLDAITTVFSVIATIFMMQRKLDAWLCWITVDALATWVYFERGVYLVGIEYFIFLCMAVYGLVNWNHQMKTQ